MFGNRPYFGSVPICINFTRSIKVVVGRFFAFQYMTFLAVPIYQTISSEYLAVSSCAVGYNKTSFGKRKIFKALSCGLSGYFELSTG